MENASKALIIAASILLAILLVAMGVRIFNQARNSYDDTALDATEINMFNSKFERYDNSQLGSQVKSLISFAISNASTNPDEPSKLPTFKMTDCADASGGTNITDATTLDSYVDALSAMRKKALSTHPYTVELHYAPKTGLIDTVTITY